MKGVPQGSILGPLLFTIFSPVSLKILYSAMLRYINVSLEELHSICAPNLLPTKALASALPGAAATRDQLLTFIATPLNIRVLLTGITLQIMLRLFAQKLPLIQNFFLSAVRALIFFFFLFPLFMCTFVFISFYLLLCIRTSGKTGYMS